jgi:CRP-like cAMP-binding protein
MGKDQTGTTFREHNVKKFIKEEYLAREGEESVGWFVLISGRIGVFKKDLQVAEFTQRGTVVGELSGILNKPRTASLKALEPTEVLVIESGLDELVVKHPDVTKKILFNLAERLAQTTENLLTSVEKG